MITTHQQRSKERPTRVVTQLHYETYLLGTQETRQDIFSNPNSEVANAYFKRLTHILQEKLVPSSRVINLFRRTNHANGRLLTRLLQPQINNANFLQGLNFLINAYDKKLIDAPSLIELIVFPNDERQALLPQLIQQENITHLFAYLDKVEQLYTNKEITMHDYVALFTQKDTSGLSMMHHLTHMKNTEVTDAFLARFKRNTMNLPRYIRLALLTDNPNPYPSKQACTPACVRKLMNDILQEPTKPTRLSIFNTIAPSSAEGSIDNDEQPLSFMRH